MSSQNADAFRTLRQAACDCFYFTCVKGLFYMGSPEFALLGIFGSALLMPSSLLAGRLLPWKWAPFVLLFLAAFAGTFVYMSWSNFPPEFRLMSAFPPVVLIGLAGGSALRCGEESTKRKWKKDGDEWALLGDEAQARGKAQIYIMCYEEAGDWMVKAGCHKDAVRCYQNAWDKLVKANGVHTVMSGLGEKLVTAMNNSGLKNEAAKIAASLKKAEAEAELIVKEEAAEAAAEMAAMPT
jgi:hypothetical protein